MQRIELPVEESAKLHKVLASHGIGSRRAMEQLIASGRCTVNGKLAVIGQRVSGTDRISIDGKLLATHSSPVETRVLLYHKPEGELVTRRDPDGRPTVFDRLPRLRGGRWVAVGRLDYNTSGLLLFTNSGGLAERLMHARFGHEREYSVRSLGELTEATLQRLRDGVLLEDGDARFDEIAAAGGEGVNRWYRVVVTEGRHRIVRRLIEAVGGRVSRLIRVRFGEVSLPPRLKRGQWLELAAAEVAALLASVESSSDRPPPQPVASRERLGLPRGAVPRARDRAPVRATSRVTVRPPARRRVKQDA
jgi:23S rRNA pseudouridine2605 synthase